MALEFKGSPRPTIGLEIEIQLLDPESRDLTPRSIPLLERCKERGIERVKAEFTQAMIEIDTEITDDVKACRRLLDLRIAQLREASRQASVMLAVSGTHPFQRWADGKVYPNERYGQIWEKFQWIARRQTVFGMHVHVGVESGDRAIAISNAAIRYLPHLLALSTSSPYWQGTDTGMESCRTGVITSFPISGLPYYFPSWDEFERYVETQRRAQVIESHKDLYWFVRPSPHYGTLEFRVFDGIPTVTDTMALVALTQALVVWLDERIAAGDQPPVSMRRYWIAPENQWVAARYGLDGTIIVSEDGERRKLAEEVLRLVERLRPIARRLRSTEELEHVATIVRRGTSARRQRAVFRETGDLVNVVDALIREFETNVPMGAA